MSQIDFEAVSKELEWQFEKSSGPGGQHVNTSDSKAKMTWDIEQTQLLSEAQKVLLKKNLKDHLNKDQTILKIQSQKHRSQDRNKQDCLKKLKKLLEEKALFKPKKRIPSKPTKASIKKRLDSKSKRSDLKANRKKFSEDY